MPSQNSLPRNFGVLGQLFMKTSFPGWVWVLGEWITVPCFGSLDDLAIIDALSAMWYGSRPEVHKSADAVDWSHYKPFNITAYRRLVLSKHMAYHYYKCQRRIASEKFPTNIAFLCPFGMVRWGPISIDIFLCDFYNFSCHIFVVNCWCPGILVACHQWGKAWGSWRRILPWATRWSSSACRSLHERWTTPTPSSAFDE